VAGIGADIGHDFYTHMETFNVKNYTSEVPATRTAERIEAFLVKAGATYVNKQYQAGSLTGINFAIEVSDGVSVAYQLPVNVEAMRDYMNKQRRRTKTWLTDADIKRIAAQAERTAWKIMQDWVEAQLSLVATNQAELAQVFLAYAHNGTETFYANVKRRGFAQIAAPTTE
jgi:hypothetical protein